MVFKHCRRRSYDRSSIGPARGVVILLLRARKRQPVPLLIVVILATMRFGKIYFYDRLGNRVPFSADSIPRDRRIKGHRLPDLRSDPFDVPNFRPHVADHHYFANSPYDEQFEPVSPVGYDLAAGKVDSPLMSDDVNDFPIDPVDPISGRDELGGHDGNNDSAAKFGRTYIHLDHDDDDDLCESCKWREQQLMNAAALAEERIKKARENETNMREYGKRQADLALTQQQIDRDNARKLRVEIQEINKRLAEEQRNRREPLADGGYLLYNRPDTAAVNRDKQRVYKDALEKQIQDKRSDLLRTRELELQKMNQYNNATIQHDSRQRENERLLDVRRKQEYRRALDAQIAAREPGDFPGEHSDLWWARTADPTAIEVATDQRQRVARQEAAVRNLETFKQRLDEADQNARAEQKERRERMYGKPEVMADAPDYEGARTARKEAAHEAWAKAHRDNQVKYDVLQQAPVGAIVEQFRKYKRCRRCHKTIGETLITQTITPTRSDVDLDLNDYREVNFDPNLLRPDRNTIKSRHLQLN
uniref:Uncharacterized protein n=1 Tax=Plectus sambesii TaxID=2011161 RepID=A0A914VWD5_9BILA